VVHPVTRVLYLDVETTGTNPDVDQVIELAFLIPGERHAAELQFKPTVPIHPRAQAVHGITAEMLVDALPFCEWIDSISGAFATAEVVVGYNVDFDLRMLRKEFERADKMWPIAPNVPVVDAFMLWKICESRSLAAAHERFVGRPLSSAHRAIADVQATMDVLEGMRTAFDLRDLTWEELAAKIDPNRANRFGPTAHLRWVDEQLIITFGKHQGKSLLDLRRSHPSYLQWIVDSRANFPAHVVEACRRALAFGGVALHEWARSQS
jgi:DNA polymerase-3 subunit epsilon